MTTKRKIRRLLLFLVAGGVVVWLVQGGYLSQTARQVSQMLSGNQNRTLTVKDYEFFPVQRRDIHQKVLATGTVSLKTGAEVKIGSRLSGKVDRLNVRIGDFIRKDETIAVIEHDDLVARVAQFQADLKAEKAKLAKIRQEGPLEINKARAELEELQVRLGLAEKTLKRNIELREKGVVAESVVDEAEEQVKVLEAQIKVAVEDLKLKIARLEHDTLLAEALMEKAEANLLEEETELSYATITAPIDGVVASISTQEGETVAAGLQAPTFVTLIDLRKLEVTTFVDETDIGRVKIGQKAVFTVDAFPEKIFKGEIREIHPKAVIKDNVVNYEAMLEIHPENITLLRPEMTANVVITTGTHTKVLSIPKGAVKRRQKSSYVVVNLKGELVEKPIQTGWREGGFMEVTSGLKEGERVGVVRKPKVEKTEKRRRRR